MISKINAKGIASGLINSLILLFHFFREELTSSCISNGFSQSSPTLCIDQYWVNQWLKNYSGGFVKRGLIGEVLRHTVGTEVNMLLLNIVGIMLLSCLGILIYILLIRLSEGRWALSTLIGSLLLLSPFGKVLAETTMDPLHLCLILASSCLLTQRQTATRNILVPIIYIVCALIYEGSILLMLPYVFWLSSNKHSRAAAVGAGLLLLVLFKGPDPVETSELISSSLRVVNPFTQGSLDYQYGGNQAVAVGFVFNIKQEFSRYLSDSPRDTFARVTRSLGAVIVYLIAIQCSLISWNKNAHNRMLKIWLSWIPLGLPFVLITHDWFRYGVFLLFLALLVSTDETVQPRERSMPVRIGVIRVRLESLTIAILSMCIIIGPLNTDVRKFLPHNYFHASLGMFLVSLAFYVIALRAQKPLAN